MKHYKKALELAEKYHHGEHRIGELYGELGWAEIMMGHLRTGRLQIEEGVRLMENANTGPGFVIRGKRKLALARAASLNIRGFLEAADSANRLIEEHGIYDQKRFPLNLVEKFEWLNRLR